MTAPRPPGDVDVDARFLLANERTLLAWVRTSLTLLAFGGAAAQLSPRHHRSLAALLVITGMLTVGAGLQRYRQADHAIRTGSLPGTGRAPYALVGLVMICALALLAAVLLDR